MSMMRGTCSGSAASSRGTRGPYRPPRRAGSVGRPAGTPAACLLPRRAYRDAVERRRVRREELEHLGLGRGLGERAEHLTGDLDLRAGGEDALPRGVDLRVHRRHGERADRYDGSLAAEDLGEIGGAVRRGQVVVAVDVDRAGDGNWGQQASRSGSPSRRLLDRAVERWRRALEDDEVRLGLHKALVLLQLLAMSRLLPVVRTVTLPMFLFAARSFFRLATSWTWKSLTSCPQDTATV